MFAVMKKELKSYFLTPVGYIFIGLYLGLFSFNFLVYIFGNSYDNFEYLYCTWITIISLCTIPLLTMGLFSAERKSGTEQLILTSPRSMVAVVMGKFVAAGIVLLLCNLLTLIYYAILEYFGSPSFLISILTLGGYFLLGLAFVAFGMFASSITENQIVSFFISVFGILAFWLIPSIINGLDVFSLINVFMSNFPNGLFSISATVTFITFTALFISLTVVVLQRRKNVK